VVFLECGGDGGWLGVLGGYVKEGRLRPGGDGQRWRRARSRVVTPGGHENSGAASRRKRQLPSPSVGPSVADVVDHSLHRQARRRRVVSSVSRKRPPGGGDGTYCGTVVQRLLRRGAAQRTGPQWAVSSAIAWSAGPRSALWRGWAGRGPCHALSGH